MQLLGIKLDLKWLVQVICTVFLIAFGLLHVVKSAASKYFEVDANFESGGGYNHHNRKKMPGPAIVERADCAVCGNEAPKKCSRCKSVRYCSQACQSAHWKSEHKFKCKVFQPSFARAIENGSSKPIKQLKKVLFSYDEFIELYNWEKAGFPPCGLLNCGNSCFANVVLQCLSSTRPLVAYLLKKGHQKDCRRNDWCFMCELQAHLERASHSLNPFSPISILSRLPNIGGNLGYGRQEDAHEFMRFAIDTMQSVCLDEFGGEKAVHPSAQETTLVQHIFGGRLQSQVICTKCNKVSNQYENMMDLTVEIHGDASSLEECLEQFTEKEQLHGDNMYKCDGCNDYVQAWKRLTVRRAPNILTIALKRFQSGRFGKLNKKINFPETLDLSPYMGDSGDGTDIYKLYAVVVHVDMLNASFFGHYICYTKDFLGKWYRIDDCKVTSVELEEVLSQGAYMLLYSRVSPRPSDLMTPEASQEENSQNSKVHLEPYVNGQAESLNSAVNFSVTHNSSSEESLVGTNDNALQGEPIDIDPNVNIVSEEVPSCETECLVEQKMKDTRQGGQHLDEAVSTVSLSGTREISICEECPASANLYTGVSSSPGNAVISNGDLGSGPFSKRDDICCNGHAGVEGTSKDLRGVVLEHSPCYTNGDAKDHNLLQEVP